MPVNLIQYTASVGVFNNRDNNSKTKYLNYATILSVIYYVQLSEIIQPYTLFQTAISSSLVGLLFLQEAYR